MGMEIFLIAALIPFLIVKGTLIGNAVYLSMGIIGFAIFRISYVRRKKIEVIYEKCEIISSVLLTFLFVIMLSIFDILDSGFLDIDALTGVYPSIAAHVIRVWGYIIYLPSVFIASFIIVRCVVHIALNKKTCGEDDKNTYKCCLVIIGLFSFIYLFSTYPGIWIESDVAVVWGGVSGKNWSAWHTLGYELFVALCSFIKKTPFTINVIQTILWIFLNAYILKVLQEESARKMKLYTAILIFVATPFNYLEVMYKDVVFSMGIFAITVATYHIIKKQGIIWQDVLVLTVGGAFASLCRHAGNVAVMFGLVLTLVYFLFEKQKKICIYLVGIAVFQIGLFSFVNVTLMNKLNVAENPAYIKYTMPMVAISAAAHNNIEFEPEEILVLEKVMSVEEWGNCYNKYWADDIGRSWGKIGGRINTVRDLVDNEQYGRELLKINANLLVRHPYTYIKSIFDMNNIMWKMAKPNDGYEWVIATVPNNEQIIYLAPFKFTNLYTQFINNVPWTNAIFARGGVALFIILFGGVIWILQKKRNLLIALATIIIYESMLIISIPSQDPRYILPAIECAIFLTSVVFGKNNKM